MDDLRRHHHRHRRRRRHARAPPRAFGQADPAARAGRLAAARAAELARPRTSSSTTATSRPTPGTTTQGKAFQPQIHYFVGGATKLYGAALYRLREEDFGELRHHDGISPAWPISYDELGALLHARRAALPGARRAGGGSDRAAGERALSASRRCRTSRGSSSSPTTSRPRATTRSTRRAASCSTRRTCRTAPASVAPRATASPASCTPSPTPRCSACGRRSSTPTSRC